MGLEFSLTDPQLIMFRANSRISTNALDRGTQGMFSGYLLGTYISNNNKLITNSKTHRALTQDK